MALFPERPAGTCLPRALTETLEEALQGLVTSPAPLWVYKSSELSLRLRIACGSGCGWGTRSPSWRRRAPSSAARPAGTCRTRVPGRTCGKPPRCASACLLSPPPAAAAWTPDVTDAETGIRWVAWGPSGLSWGCDVRGLHGCELRGGAVTGLASSGGGRTRGCLPQLSTGEPLYGGRVASVVP